MEAISALEIEVGDLDDSALLAAASDAQRGDREIQLTKLRIAYEWCVRHPATSETGTATWGDAGLPGLGDCDASLGGDGSPAVAAFVAEELGAAMGVSTQAAMSLMADALDLRHRLPRLWALVEDVAVVPWKTRRVAADTRSLPFEGARWVDEELASRPRRAVKTNLYVHVSLADLATPPAWMRELVIVRDRHCVFPWCGRDARACDLDHMVAYVPPDDSGPPGQTNPQNLAPLCRRHHRAKTFTGWTYQRQRDGTYEWTSPHGGTWTVGRDGTSRTRAPSPAPADGAAAYILAT